jgi:gliding motility-associated lipoprotein GldH
MSNNLSALRAFLFVIVLAAFGACGTIDVFEKNVAIPGHAWSNSFRPEITFEISDTNSLYNIFVVLRHTNSYRYNNLWLNVYTQAPGDTVRRDRLDLRLATDDKGWLGSGMDDVFEHRIIITREPVALKPGKYTFTLEQIMREEPLRHVMNAGIRVEKVNSGS